MTVVAEPKDAFLHQFDDAGAGRFAPLRRRGRERFAALPLPGTKSEDWRFTSITPLLRQPFARPAAGDGAVALPPLPTADTLRLVFVNGRFRPDLSALQGVPTGITVGPLADVPEAAIAALATVADVDGQVFTALNTGLLQDGACVVVPDGVPLLRPVEIIYATEPGAVPIATHPRTLLVVGRGAQATVVERFAAAADAAYFTNAVAEVVVGENAAVDHYKVQLESAEAYHVATTQVVQAARSTFSTHFLSFGGALVRNEVRVRFAGSNAEATVNGLYLGAGRQHVDNFTEIDHALPHCASHELYKGILADHAHGVFNGKIFVRQDAQKTDAKQTNKVLLLSPDATINTKPQLEIFADDVKCTHGATVGQLDPDQRFYLQARGIGAAAADRLLTFAFANDVVRRIKIEAIRDELEQRIVRQSL